MGKLDAAKYAPHRSGVMITLTAKLLTHTNGEESMKAAANTF